MVRRSLLLLAASAGVAQAAAGVRTPSATPNARLLAAPIQFEPNVGQAPSAVSFLARDPGAALLVESTGFSACFSTASRPAKQGRPVSRAGLVKLRLLGGNPHPRTSGTDPLPGRVNYLLGNDPSKWKVDVPTFAGVRQDGVYPGIDVQYHGSGSTAERREVEYDFLVAPRAHPELIRLQVAGAGPEDVRIERDGDLLVRTPAGDLRQMRPAAYQVVGGARRRVPAEFCLAHSAAKPNADSGVEVSFRVGDYDRSRALVIDPVLSYCTMIAGTGNDKGIAVTMSARSDCYVTGFTDSLDLPLSVKPLQKKNLGGGEAFVSCFRPSSSGAGSRIFTTYLGGKQRDTGMGIALDFAGNVYVSGTTMSTDFPTVHQIPGVPTAGGAFVTCLSPDGRTIRFSTVFGTLMIEAYLAVDGRGSAYLAGRTLSQVLPVVGGFQSTLGGLGDGFLCRIDSNPSTGALSLGYSTYIGGAAEEGVRGIAVGRGRVAYLTGFARSSGIFGGTIQSNLNGTTDAFVMEVDTAQTGPASRVFSTYLGGSSDDDGNGVSVDDAGRIYVTGGTKSPDFPGAGSYPAVSGGSAAWLAVLDTAGAQLLSSLVVDGTNFDTGFGIAQQGMSRVWIAGQTGSDNLPVLQPSDYHGGFDAFVLWADMSQQPPQVMFARYLGSGGLDQAQGIAMDAHNNVAVTGAADQADGTFPIVNQFEAGNPGGTGGFLAYFQAVVPNAPTNLVAAPAAPTVVNLSWQHQSTVEFGFEIERSPDLTGAAHFGLIGSTGSKVFTDFDAHAAVTYTYRVRAVALDGPGPFSNEASATTPVDIPATPLAPVTATPHISGREMSIHWVDGSTGPGDRAASFDVERLPDGNGVNSFGKIGSAPGTTTTFLDVTVLPESTYHYRIRAVNAAGVSNYSPEAEGTTGVETFSIEGALATQPSGGLPEPIADAEVVVSPGGHLVQTDFGGHYLVEGLAPGVYTVTPTLEGLTFTPPGQQVAVGPSKSGVDFVAVGAIPVITILAPHFHDTLKGPTVSVTASVTVVGAVSWRVLLDSVEIRHGNTRGARAINFRTSMADGLHVLRFNATSTGGAAEEKEVEFYVDGTRPQISLFYPLDPRHQPVLTSPVQFRGAVNDTAVAPYERVTWSLSVDNTPVITNSHDVGPQSILGIHEFPVGSHVVRVRAVDDAGNIVSLTRHFRVTALNGPGGLLKLIPANGAVDYGDVTPVRPYQERVLQITNLGTGVLRWDEDLPGVEPIIGIHHFQLENYLHRKTLQPGEGTWMYTRYLADSLGVSTSSFTMTSDDPSFSSVQIGLTGREVP